MRQREYVKKIKKKNYTSFSIPEKVKTLEYL